MTKAKSCKKACNPIANVMENSLKYQDQNKQPKFSWSNVHSSDGPPKDDKQDKGRKIKITSLVMKGAHKISSCSKIKSALGWRTTFIN